MSEKSPEDMSMAELISGYVDMQLELKKANKRVSDAEFRMSKIEQDVDELKKTVYRIKDQLKARGIHL